MELISIIMSTYNTPKEYLSKAIESILNQTYKRLEFIIVCDGSEEEYKYINDNYRDTRITLILNNRNQGLPYSLNKAIAECHGEYIARMDSDDIALANRLEKQILFLKKTGYDLCGTYARQFGEVNGIKRLQFVKPDEVQIQLLFRATLIHPTVMARREVFDDFKYNAEFSCSQDFELWNRVLVKYKIAILPCICLYYRIHKDQISVQKRNEQRINAIKIIQNNADNIAKDDKRVFNALWYLSGREKITRDNYNEFCELIDYFEKMNKATGKYDSKKLKVILNNRFFELILKNHLFVRNPEALLRIVHIYNIRELIYKI